MPKRMIAVAVLIGGLAVAETSLGQGYSSRIGSSPYGNAGRARAARPTYYTPRRPTLSPYLELTRPQQGPLPNYHQFVRPRQQVLREFQQNEQQIRLLQREINQQQQQSPTTGRVAPSSAAPTGGGATFFNYSHFYPVLGGSR